MQRTVVQLNVDVTPLIKLPVGGVVALRALLSDGNLDLHNGPGCICELYWRKSTLYKSQKIVTAESE